MNEHSFIFASVLRTRDENKELAIRKKAVKMIVKDGIEGLSMQKLAKAAKVSPATIYIYFKDKYDLILQLFMEANQKMLNATLEGFDPQMHFDEGMRIQWKNRAKYFMKYPDEVVFLEHCRHSPFYEKLQPTQMLIFKEVMSAFVHNAIKRKELISLPFEVYWSVAFAPLYQLVKYHNQGRSYAANTFVLTDKLMNQTLDLVLKALRP